MALIAISALPDGGELITGDTIPIVRAGVTRKAVHAPSDWEVVLRAGSVVAQNPSALDTALKVEFGAEQDLTAVTLSATGDITFNEAGTYQVTAIFTFGRTTATAVSKMFLRSAFNGSPLGAVIAISMTGSDVVVPVALSNIFAVSATNVLSIEIVRDSSGVNNGGLITETPLAAGWNPSSSSTLVVSRIV